MEGIMISTFKNIVILTMVLSLIILYPCLAAALNSSEILENINISILEEEMVDHIDKYINPGENRVFHSFLIEITNSSPIIIYGGTADCSFVFKILTSDGYTINAINTSVVLSQLPARFKARITSAPMFIQFLLPSADQSAHFIDFDDHQFIFSKR